jgi:hypothetical protein
VLRDTLERPRCRPQSDDLAVLIGMLESVEDKTGEVFDGTNLRRIWHKPCAEAKLGTPTEVEGKAEPRYDGLIIHDLRRSAIKNLIKAGMSEKEAMTFSGHKTRAVFDRCHIVDSDKVVEAMRRVQGKGLASVSVKIVKTPRIQRRRKLLTA